MGGFFGGVSTAWTSLSGVVGIRRPVGFLGMIAPPSVQPYAALVKLATRTGVLSGRARSYIISNASRTPEARSDSNARMGSSSARRYGHPDP